MNANKITPDKILVIFYLLFITKNTSAQTISSSVRTEPFGEFTPADWTDFVGIPDILNACNFGNQ